MKQTSYNRYYSFVRYIKKHLELPYPFIIRRVKMPNGYDGDCRIKNNKFLIRVEKSLSEHYSIDVLIHEVSHCLSWEEENEHGVAWGKAYSKVYRKFLEWLEWINN